MEALLNNSFADSGLTLDGKDGLGSGLALLMDELAYGVLVTNLQGQLLHANQAARHELGRFRVLGVSGAESQLQTLGDDDTRVLQDALGKVAEGKRSLITLGGAEAASLTLAVLPLKGEAGAPPVRAALLFSRASVCESLMLCFFARSHGLTSTEEHVLGILCHGYSAPEIARQMNVAVSTVRSHVRSLCAKTRSSGVRELMNRVAVLPPVAPALRYEQMH
ncbi:MAG: helix-turn-helix transcriptional regulator [Ramlibacter sp.]|nr:helix-turn-helix transcriptional regulator [Ramlibacter sp.]